MKASDLLKQQHREVEALLEKLTTATPSKRSELAQEIALKLHAHMKIEEQIYYPAAKRATHDGDMIGEAYEEHAVAEFELKRILKIDPKDDSFKAKATVLKELIAHHVDEEEKEMLPKAESKFGKGRSEALCEEMQRVFDRAVGVKAVKEAKAPAKKLAAKVAAVVPAGVARAANKAASAVAKLAK